jgi:hypothetical protein
MRAIESWQTKRNVAASIQRMPVPAAAPLAAGAVPEKGFWEEAKGSPCDLAVADTMRGMQCSRMAQKNDFEIKEF